MRTTAAILVTVGFCLLAACGTETKYVEAPPADQLPTEPSAEAPTPGATTDSDDNAALPDPRDLKTSALSAAECDAYVRCNDGGHRAVIEFYGDRHTCVIRHDGAMRDRMLLPGAAFTQDAIDTCAKRLSDENACATARSYAECNFKGLQEDGIVCNDGAQCKTGYCAKENGAECGMCAPAFALDDDCSGDPLGCGVGMFCGGTSKVCLARLKGGTSCKGNFNFASCEDGFACVDDKCKPLVAEGGECILNTGVSGCVHGLDCVEGKCSQPPELTVLKLGEACTVAAEDEVCSEGRCDTDEEICVNWENGLTADVCE